MLISKLIPEELLKRTPLEELRGRCTGKSTGAALRLIGKAMENPAERIYLAPMSSQARFAHEVSMIKYWIDRCGLKHISVEKDTGSHRTYLIYDIFTDITTGD
jgi:hypothetical protein